jgi:hypothetical protein
MPVANSVSKTSIQPRINPAFTQYPGQVYIWTGGSYYLSAPDGGGHIDDTAIQTEIRYAPGRLIGDWLKFTLWHDFAGHVAFQTSGGNFVTAVSGGGRTSDVIHTDATDIAAWEEFQIAELQTVYLSIQTASKNFLTAVGGGRQLTDAIHSDAVTVSGWEAFSLKKAGDLGSRLQYLIVPVLDGSLSGYPIFANNGGNLTQNTLSYYTDTYTPSNWARFTLIQQPNGSYGVQTATSNYLTAVNGGGLDFGTPASDNIQTNRTAVEAWEQFRFIEIGDSTYAIQTVDGHYLGLHPVGQGENDEGRFSTNISEINAALRFWLVPATFF